MSSPSDNDLNRAMALECGYRWYRVMRCTHDSGPEGIPHRMLATEESMSEWDATILATGDEPIYDDYAQPHYCSDRNSHGEIKRAIDTAQAWYDFSHEMRNVCIGLPDWENSRTFTVTFAPPRLVVIAALRALGKWEWDSEEGEA